MCDGGHFVELWSTLLNYLNIGLDGSVVESVADLFVATYDGGKSIGWLVLTVKVSIKLNFKK